MRNIEMTAIEQTGAIGEVQVAARIIEVFTCAGVSAWLVRTWLACAGAVRQWMKCSVFRSVGERGLTHEASDRTLPHSDHSSCLSVTNDPGPGIEALAVHVEAKPPSIPDVVDVQPPSRQTCIASNGHSS